jgi:NAD(P)-dependent dehydrogenase (short-subunit alcohol dehydrogenase family)
VTEPAQVQAAVERVDSLDVLINNAGVALTTELSDRAALSIDTDMIRDLDIPKASPRAVARGIFDGVERGEEEIFPDPMSEKVAASWRMGRRKRSSARTPRSSQGPSRRKHGRRRCATSAEAR